MLNVRANIEKIRTGTWNEREILRMTVMVFYKIQDMHKFTTSLSLFLLYLCSI